jgi:hypothetical protein
MITILMIEVLPAEPSGRGGSDREPSFRPALCSADHGLQLALAARAFLARVEATIELAGAQRAAFEIFKSVVQEEIAKVHDICSGDRLLTPTDELEIAARQIDGSLRAIRAMRPAAEAFCVSLTPAQAEALGPFEQWFVLASSVWSSWVLNARSGQQGDVRQLGQRGPIPRLEQFCSEDGCVCLGDRCYAVPHSSPDLPRHHRWRDQKDFGKLWTE